MSDVQHNFFINYVTYFYQKHNPSMKSQQNVALCTFTNSELQKLPKVFCFTLQLVFGSTNVTPFPPTASNVKWVLCPMASASLTTRCSAVTEKLHHSPNDFEKYLEISLHNKGTKSCIIVSGHILRSKVCQNFSYSISQSYKRLKVWTLALTLLT